MSEGYGVPAPTRYRGDRSERLARDGEAGSRRAEGHRGQRSGHVADTAKGEAKAVAQEVKYQAKDLYAQTQRELKDQAQVQQQRAAAGLRSVSDELDSMTANAQNPGLAVDLLHQVSDAALGCRVVAGRS